MPQPIFYSIKALTTDAPWSAKINQMIKAAGLLSRIYPEKWDKETRLVLRFENSKEMVELLNCDLAKAKSHIAAAVRHLPEDGNYREVIKLAISDLPEHCLVFPLTLYVKPTDTIWLYPPSSAQSDVKSRHYMCILESTKFPANPGQFVVFFSRDTMWYRSRGVWYDDKPFTAWSELQGLSGIDKDVLLCWPHTNDEAFDDFAAEFPDLEVTALKELDGDFRFTLKGCGSQPRDLLYITSKREWHLVLPLLYHTEEDAFKIWAAKLSLNEAMHICSSKEVTIHSDAESICSVNIYKRQAITDEAHLVAINAHLARYL